MAQGFGFNKIQKPPVPSASAGSSMNGMNVGPSPSVTKNIVPGATPQPQVNPLVGGGIKPPSMPTIQQPNPQPIQSAYQPTPNPQTPQPQTPQQSLVNQPWVGGGGLDWAKIGSPLAQDPSLINKGNNNPNLIRNAQNNWGFF